MKVPVHNQAHLHLVQAATLFLIRSLFKDFPVSHHRHAHSDHRIKREIFIHDQDIRITFFLHSTLFGYNSRAIAGFLVPRARSSSKSIFSSFTM